MGNRSVKFTPSQEKDDDEGKMTSRVKSQPGTCSELKLRISSRESSILDSLDTELPGALVTLGYELHKKIGEGCFSLVYLATNRRLPGIQLACKVFDLRSLNSYWKETFLKKEMKIMTKVHHKNVCSAYDVFKMRTKAYIFMKFAPNGTLDSWMSKHDGRLKEEAARKYFFGIMSGLEYLHAHNIAHRDLKLENILLDVDGECLITDFGFACLNDSIEQVPIMRQTACGSALYVAPEARVLRNKEYDAKRADVYSTGVCLYEMVHGFRPFDGDYPMQSKELLLLQLNCDFKISKSLNLSSECRHLIMALLQPNPNKRPSARTVLEHAWLRSLNKENTESVPQNDP